MTAKERMDPHERKTGGREAEGNGPAVKETEAAFDGAKGRPAER